MNPGVTGFQQAQGIPFFSGDSYVHMGMNSLFNFGLQSLAKHIPGGEALTRGMMPFGGLQTSRTDFLAMRARQDIVDSMFKAEPGGGFAYNPALQLLGRRGVGSNPFGQMMTGMFTGYKTRFEAFYGATGRAFGGSEKHKARSALQAMMAIDTGNTLDGGGLDYLLTQGLDRDELREGMTTAYRRGAFITSKDLNEVAGAVSRGSYGEARRLGRKMSGEMADVMATGRDVFGQSATQDDIISGLKNIFGQEGVGSASEAANRLREIEAAGQVLNLDSKVVASYMQVMKQLTKNMGLIGEAGTSASLGMMMANEANVRFGEATGVNVDKGAQATSRSASIERNIGSFDAKQKEALTYLLRSTQGDVLRDISLNIGGRKYSGLQVRNRINKFLNTEGQTADEIAAGEDFIEAAVDSMNVSKDPAGKALARTMRQLTAFSQTDLVNMIANSDKSGGKTYSQAVAERGYGANDLSIYRKMLTSMNSVSATGTARGAGLAGRYGTSNKVILEGLLKANYFGAMAEGDLNGLDENLRKAFPGMSANEIEDLKSFAGSSLIGIERSEGQTADDTLRSLSATGSRNYGGNQMHQLREEKRKLEVFSKIAGGMPIGSGQLLKRGLTEVLKQLNSGKGLGGDAWKKILGKTLDTERVAAFSDLLSGQATAVVDGKEMTFKDLNDQANDLAASGMSKKDSDAKIAALSNKFWSSFNERNRRTAAALAPEEVVDEAQERGGVIGSAASTATNAVDKAIRASTGAGSGKAGSPDKDTALGGGIPALLGEIRSSGAAKADEAIGVLKQILEATQARGVKTE